MNRHPDWKARRRLGRTTYTRTHHGRTYEVAYDEHRRMWTLGNVEACSVITEAHSAQWCIQSLDASIAAGVQV